MVNRRDADFYSAGIKLLIFTTISVIITGFLAVIMGNYGFGDTKEYSAIFRSATSLEKGDDVRIAGVSVGEVTGVDHHEANFAKISFTVDADVEMTTATRAEIRFLNLVGDRYMAVVEGNAQGAEPIDEDDVIPMERTKPALDLTVLFDGFKPLFQALTPDQVNELTLNLIQVLQGEGGTIRGLLEHTSSLTNTLADRDQLIGEVIGNLSTTLETVDSRHVQLERLIVELRDWMGDLAKDRAVIGNSLDNISNLTVALADLLREVRPVAKADIAELRKLSALLNKPKNRKILLEIFDRLPESMTDQTRTGTYGSWYSYYLCGVGGTIKLPLVDGLPIIGDINQALTQFGLRSTAPRCQQR